MRIVASVQARLGSTRLPGKVLLHLAKERILERVIEQVEGNESVDELVVAIGDNPENKAISEYCKRKNFQYIVGPEDDLLTRHLKVVEKTDCDILIRITADCPFVPSEEIDRVIEEHLANDARYTTNVFDKMPVGTSVDVLEPDLLRKLKALGETHPVKLARGNPDKWGTTWTHDPKWSTFSEVHMAIDTPNDYWSLVDAVEAVGDDPRAIAKWLNK